MALFLQKFDVSFVLDVTPIVGVGLLELILLKFAFFLCFIWDLHLSGTWELARWVIYVGVWVFIVEGLNVAGIFHDGFYSLILL